MKAKKIILIILLTFLPIIVNARIAPPDTVGGGSTSASQDIFGGGNTDVSQECESLLGSPTVYGSPAFLLNKAFQVVRYVAIILLVALSVFDFVSAITSNDENAIKKATSKTIKRAIICVIIFFLPLLIELILKYLDDQANSLCGIGR